MGSVTVDELHDDLVWMEFDGPTWDEYHVLLNELVALAHTHPTPFCMIFVPAIDMPKGSPMPHMQRMMSIMEREEKFEMMVAVVPGWMRIAATFAKMMMRLFQHNLPEGQTIAKTREEAFAIYEQYHARRMQPQPPG